MIENTFSKPRKQFYMALGFAPLLLCLGATANTGIHEFASNDAPRIEILANNQQDSAETKAPKERPLPFTVDTWSA